MTIDKSRLHPETLAAQGLGRVADPYRDIVPPIYVSTTYERGADGATVAVDSTAATPLLTRPIELGAHIVMHSATKYLNGHSDVIAGVLATAQDDPRWQRMRYLRGAGGAVLGPLEAWLLLRGMRTLPLRVAASCRNAHAIALRLQRHPKLSHVLYPGLPTHPAHLVAARQMRGGFGGMMSLRLAGGEA